MSEKEVAAEDKAAKEVVQKGFTLLVDEEGVIKLTPINLVNDFELAGYLQYGAIKGEELLKGMGRSPEHRTLDAVGQLTGLLGQIFEQAQKQVDGEKAKA